VKSIKPDMEQSECQKQKIAEAFYGGRKTILKGLQNPRTPRRTQRKEVIAWFKTWRSNLQNEVQPKYNDDADIDYKNERNMKFS
jgi:hypothetical protein